MTDDLSDVQLNLELRERLDRRIDLRDVCKICGTAIVVAGGALLADEPNDFDIYAASSDRPLDFDEISRALIGRPWKKVGMTKNAMTLKDQDGRVYQFCSYAKKTPKELIASFDFAHCQVGLAVSWDPHDVTTSEAVYTKAFIKAMALQRTSFTGTEYPLSSLIRLVKYAKRGWYGEGRGYVIDVIKIVNALISRGFKDYDDFKDQLDAVDLGLSSDNTTSKMLWYTARDHLI